MRHSGIATWGFLGIASLAGSLLATAWGSGAAEPAPEKSGWRIAEPAVYRGMAVFPVLARDNYDTSPFQSLDEGLRSGDVVITESGGGEMVRRSRDGRPMDFPVAGARVNQLVLVNRGKRPVLLLAGELVRGGKQDRVIGKDRIVPAGGPPLPLDVFCVEQGRWSSGSKFGSGQLIVHPSVREKAAVDQAQAGVWGAVRSGTTSRSANARRATDGPPSPVPLSSQRVAEVIGRSAPTAAYAKIYDSDNAGFPIEQFVQEMHKRFEQATSGLKDEHVVGVVVAYGDQVAWSDVFASSSLFEGYWPKLLRSYVIEALARPASAETAPAKEALAFLEPLHGRSTVESEPGVYSWREVTDDRYAEIMLYTLRPAEQILHWVKVRRTT